MSCLYAFILSDTIKVHKMYRNFLFHITTFKAIENINNFKLSTILSCREYQQLYLNLFPLQIVMKINNLKLHLIHFLLHKFF